ncbi:MAG: flagellar hook-basal body complex protein [Pseudomonadales bacterium]|nr:flagellar hook-basal body complex protein [Pseudomonadales bacterium]MCP5331367.1 flagellar hook-basal body complex protein [Pseudomonadales bacterium]MCP5344376.1 flagellar hook-basal body complex protein [Pseudomonadales bacterium]
MSFNIGLSALAAAQEEIAVTGNNIANASTNGFKSSRTEFADVFAASVLGGGASQTGGGVGVQAISQNFSQGNITFTDNTLDLAINGNGFFILRGEDGNVFTRAGSFGTDRNGNIVNSLGEKLQGFAATPDGKASGGGPLTDLVVTTGEIPPQATTLVSSRINLDATASPSSIIGTKVLSNSGQSGVPQFGTRVARPAVVSGTISTAGTDFSGTTSARTVGTSNVSGGINFTAGTGAQSFSISVNGGPFQSIDLSAVNAADGTAVVAAVNAALAGAGFTGANAIDVSLENNRLVLQTTATGDSSRITISAVQGLASNIVSATDVKGKTAPPTGFTITLDGVSRNIVIDKNFTNTGAAALALGGGSGSGNEALEDYIQSQINTSAALLGKVTVSIDANGAILFETTSQTAQTLTVNPLNSVSGGVSFDQVVSFATTRRTGTLDTTDLDFSTDNTSFTITVDGQSLQITLADDYNASGGPSSILGEFAESGLEALEDEIQKQINASTLPGAVNVSVGSDGRIVFEITDSDYKSLKVASDSKPAQIQGAVNVSSGYDFSADNYTFTITYEDATLGTVTSNAITLDQKYDTGQEVIDALQNEINTDTNFAFPLGKEQVRARLDSATGQVIIETVDTGPSSELNVAVTAPGAGPYVIGNPGAPVNGQGPELDFASIVTFNGSELSNTGAAAVGNGYAAETIQVTDGSGTKQLVTVAAGSTAAQVAQQFSNVPGITATASTVAYIVATNTGDPENKGAGSSGVIPNLPLNFTINGSEFETPLSDPNDRLQDLVNQINGSTGNLSARLVTLDSGTQLLEVTENNGANLVFTGGANGKGAITIGASTRDPVSGELVYDDSVATKQIANLANLSNDGVVVGGVVEFTLDENVVMVDAAKSPSGVDILPVNNSIFGNISDSDALVGTQFELNTFDPLNPETYYRSTAVAIFDTVGIQHTLTQYFVKERANGAGDVGGVWSVYFQIDGKDIGYDPGGLDTTPVLAKATVRFNEAGLYDQTQDPIYVTNWTPLDSAGKPSGAGPVPGNTTVAELTTNSNFRIDLTKMTQYGGDFSVLSNTQNGFAKGQLTGLDINDRGAIFARFSNGQSTILGEVALAKFDDQSKLANAGGTRFSETSASGTGTPSGAGTAGLGVIQSGALEDSNVDLSEQLVQLIVSQRNFQAAAQIIESADTATQTIINL